MQGVDLLTDDFRLRWVDAVVELSIPGGSKAVCSALCVNGGAFRANFGEGVESSARVTFRCSRVGFVWCFVYFSLCGSLSFRGFGSPSGAARSVPRDCKGVDEGVVACVVWWFSDGFLVRVTVGTLDVGRGRWDCPRLSVGGTGV